MIWQNAKSFLVAFLAIILTPNLAPGVLGAAPTTGPGSSYDKPPFKKEDLEQLLAPIALYPDSLLTQMLMASTYPLEIVQADRWVKAHADLKGEALAKELEKLDWDASVKSLMNFPPQLSMMSDKLDLTLKIGNAFIEQQADVLNTVQVLRNKAQQAGNLKSDEHQKVQVQAAPTPSTPNSSTVINVIANAPASQPAAVVVQTPPQIVTIESTSPSVIYVPSYNPAYVYGGWPYPAYPPYYYYPPSYYYGSNLVSFGLGVACGVAWGYAWGNCNWGGSDVDIDINRNTEFNGNIDRDQARQNMENRQGDRQTNRQGAGQTNRQSWQHDPAHRKGAAYRDQKTADRFGGTNTSSQAALAREQYRGRAETGRQDLARNTGSIGQNRTTPANRSPAAGGLPSRTGSGQMQIPSNRAYSGTTGGTFNGVNRGSTGARTETQRGQSSLGSRPAPSRSAPARSSGGGFRGGGGGGRR